MLEEQNLEYLIARNWGKNLVYLVRHKPRTSNTFLDRARYVEGHEILARRYNTPTT